MVETSAVEAELERIVSSKEFSSSPRLAALLRYCVEQSLEGDIDSLKESVIAVRVFGRNPGYDPKLDPIVRVHARRLREKLNTFYGAVESLPVVIQVPRGRYVATFEVVPPREPAQEFPGPDNQSDEEPSNGALRQKKTGSLSPQTAAAKVENRYLPISIGIGLAVAVLVAMWPIWRAGRSTQPVVQPLVSLPGTTNDPAWAPNGKSIAFTWNGGSSVASFVYLLKTGETVPSKLTTSIEPEYHPVWSPDGLQLAFLREVGRNRFSLIVTDLQTSREHAIRTMEWPSSMVMPPALDWSPNGEWLVTSERPAVGTVPAHLLLVSPRDGRSWVITDPPNASTGDLEARFSPDGRQIVFRRGGQGELYTVSLNGTSTSTPVELTHHNAGVRGLSISRDGRDIYLGSQQSYGHFGIWRIREGEASPSRMTPESMEAVSPAIDPTGRTLAFVQRVVDLNLWLYDGRKSREPRLLAPSTQAEYSPAFSPDGTNLAFVSDRSGTANVWISAMNEGQPRQLTSLRAGDLPLYLAWSPDGKKIAYFCRRTGVNYAFETDVASGSTRTLRSGEDYSLAPQYSKDGQSLYYVSNAGHRFRIWRELLTGGVEPAPVSAEEVSFFRVSKDGRYLYFIPLDRPDKLIQLNLATKEERICWTFSGALGIFDAWDVGGTTLYYIDVESPHSLPFLTAVDLDTGERRLVSRLRKMANEWKTSISASPDGQSVVVAQSDTDDSRLMLLHPPR